MMENSPSATVVRDVAWCSVIGPRQSQKLSPDLYFSLLLIVQDISIHGATSNLTPSFSFFSASFSFSSPSFIIRNFRRLFQTFVLHLMFTFHISPNISMTAILRFSRRWSRMTIESQKTTHACQTLQTEVGNVSRASFRSLSAKELRGRDPTSLLHLGSSKDDIHENDMRFSVLLTSATKNGTFEHNYIQQHLSCNNSRKYSGMIKAENLSK